MPDNTNKPVLILSDDIIVQGINVVKTIFPDANDEALGSAAVGVFMAMLSEIEDGNVLFDTQTTAHSLASQQKQSVRVSDRLHNHRAQHVGA